MLKHLNIQVFGKVQGVLFRQETKEMAGEFFINGLVRNLPDGSVWIEAEGEEERLNEFLDWCKKGPEWAKVDKVEVQEARLKDYSDFEVH